MPDQQPKRVDQSLRIDFEASCTTEFLPKCGYCGDRHPLAYQPPRPRHSCPTCGAPASAALYRMEHEAVLTGRGAPAVLAKVLLVIGDWLRRLSRRL